MDDFDREMEHIEARKQALRNEIAHFFEHFYYPLEVGYEAQDLPDPKEALQFSPGYYKKVNSLPKYLEWYFKKAIQLMKSLAEIDIDFYRFLDDQLEENIALINPDLKVNLHKYLIHELKKDYSSIS